MRLYHFTTVEYLPAIVKAGELTPTESNLSEYREHFGPDVVWLTDDPDPSHHAKWAVARRVDDSGRTVELVPKNTARIAVDIPDSEAHHWPAWSRRHGIRNMWYRKLEVDGDPQRWWVIERPIPAAEWAEIVDPVTNEALTEKARRVG